MDRVAPDPKHTIHETTRNFTNPHESALILDGDSLPNCSWLATFCAKPLNAMAVHHRRLVAVKILEPSLTVGLLPGLFLPEHEVR